MAIYMKVEGFDSDVTQEGHEKWIELSSCRYSSSRYIPMEPGNMQDRESAVASVSDVVITGAMEKAWADLMQWILKGTGGKEIQIDFVSTGNNVYETIVLHDALLSHCGLTCGGNSKPNMSGAINFTKVEFKNFKQAQEGTGTGEPAIATYDVAKGTMT